MRTVDGGAGVNTPAHIILAMAALGKPDRKKITLWAAFGGLAPDLSLFALVGTSLFVLDIPSERVFGELFFSESWQRVFAYDNSFILWGIVAAAALWSRRQSFIVFAAGAYLHLIFDFLLHHDDARRQFWPLTNWVFRSPFSYWDPAFYGNIINPIEVAGSLVLVAYMLWRFQSWTVRGLALILGLLELSSLNHLLHFM